MRAKLAAAMVAGLACLVVTLISTASASADAGPFVCTAPTDFVSPGAPDSTLLSISESSPATAKVIGTASLEYNAIGYDQYDHYLYGIANNTNHLVRIDQDGQTTDLGAVAGLPVPTGDDVYATGAFDGSGNLWVLENSSGAQTAYAVNVASGLLSDSVKLTSDFAPIDWTYDYGYMWGLASGTLYQVNLSTGQVLTEPVSGVDDDQYNAAWTFANSQLGFVPTDANTIVKISVGPGALSSGSSTIGTISAVSGGPVDSLDSDGTSCAPPVQIGPAPGGGGLGTGGVNLSDGTYGTAYTNSLQATGGTAPYTWTTLSGSLPPGLTLASNGSISGTPTSVGTYTFTAQVTDSSGNPEVGQEQVIITVDPAPLTIKASSATLTYGSAVPAVTPSYSGFVLSDGPSSLNPGPTCSTTATSSSTVGGYPTTCTGAMDPDYTISYKSGTITIIKATPTITWANPASITYGTPLSGTQLDATASVPGAFVYTPPAGTVLPGGANQILSVTFTPTDSTDYNDAGATVHITVTKVATKLSALALVDIGPGLSIGQISAKLTRSDTGAPIAGETIAFSTYSSPLCSAPTNSSGVATCTFSLTNVLQALLSLGYQANFAGDNDYLPSSATAGLLALSGLVVADARVVARASVNGRTETVGRGTLRHHRLKLKFKHLRRGSYRVTLFELKAHGETVAIARNTIKVS